MGRSSSGALSNGPAAERAVRLATARRDGNGDIRFKGSVDAPETGNSYLLDGRLGDLSGRPRFRRRAHSEDLLLLRSPLQMAGLKRPPRPSRHLSLRRS